MTDGATDPYLWLEDIDGERVSAWVDAENARTESALRGQALPGRLRGGAENPEFG